MGRTLTTIAVSVAALAAIGTGLWALPGRFRAADEAAAAWGNTPAGARLLREAQGFGIDTGIYVLARRVIPPGATYYMITGPQVQVSSAIVDEAFPTFGQLYLLPRYPTQHVGDAEYVISYGGRLRHGLGLRFTHIWTYKTGMSIGEVAR